MKLSAFARTERRLKVSRTLLFLALPVIDCAQGTPALCAAPTNYRANDIDVNAGTIRGTTIESLLDDELTITGLAKSSSTTAAVMYLSQDRRSIDTNSYADCINLIIDPELKFSSHAPTRYAFTGKFIWMDHIDPSVVYVTYKGIRLDASCQYFKKPDRYPYFVVESFKRVRN